MNLEEKVTSLELSKQLKELGVEQKTLFYFVPNLEDKEFDNKDIFKIISSKEFISDEFKKGYPDLWFSAFTSDELMEILPAFVCTKENKPFNNFYLQINKRMALGIQYITNYVCDSYSPKDMFFRLLTENSHDKKLADCLAKMLIYLLQNDGYVKRTPVDIENLK